MGHTHDSNQATSYMPMVKHLDNKRDRKYSTGVVIRAPETGDVVPNPGSKAAKWLCVCVPAGSCG